MKFSLLSMKKLNTSHPALQRLFLEVVREFDITILCGYRDEKAQNKAVRRGYSKTPWPKSKHNVYPSHAVDICPYPWTFEAIYTKDQISRMYFMAGYVKGVAYNLGIDVIWGGDWDCDNDFTDQNFNYLLHFELVESVKTVTDHT